MSKTIKISELKILLELNGKQRLPYLEKQICRNEKILDYYSKCLTHHIVTCSLEDRLYYIALNMINGPWKEAEKYIAKDPIVSYYYAVNILKDRFMLGDESILNADYQLQKDYVYFLERKGYYSYDHVEYVNHIGEVLHSFIIHDLRIPKNT